MIDLLLNFGEFLVELVNTSVSGDEALSASVEGVAVAAGINLDVTSGGTSLEGGTAGRAGDSRVMVSRMNVFLHFLNSFRRAGISSHRERLKYT